MKARRILTKRTKSRESAESSMPVRKFVHCFSLPSELIQFHKRFGRRTRERFAPLRFLRNVTRRDRRRAHAARVTVDLRTSGVVRHLIRGIDRTGDFACLESCGNKLAF